MLEWNSGRFTSNNIFLCGNKYNRVYCLWKIKDADRNMPRKELFYWHGFNIRYVYKDEFSMEDTGLFDFVRKLPVT